jgi:hypothetical protein
MVTSRKFFRPIIKTYGEEWRRAATHPTPFPTDLPETIDIFHQSETTLFQSFPEWSQINAREIPQQLREWKIQKEFTKIDVDRIITKPQDP